jgi:tetratricopeptide (TPR) repeat protein
MRFLRLLIIIIAIGALSVACESNPEKDKSIPSATDASVDPAEALSDQIIANPNNVQLYIDRAAIYSDRKLFDLATRDIQRALSIDSLSSFVHVAMGDVYFKANALRDARLAFEKALSLNPSDTNAALKLAEVHFLLRRYEEALESVNTALKVNDQLEKGYFLKGYIYKEIGDTSLSKSSFQTAVEVNPDYYEAFIELGSLYASEGNDIALDFFNTAIELRGGIVEPYYNKGMYLQNTGRLDEAIETYQKMIEVDPKSFLSYYNLGYIHLVAYEDFKVAAAYFDTVLSIQPQYVDAIYNKGLCYEEIGDANTSEALYRSALDIDPQHTLSAQGLSRLLE